MNIYVIIHKVTKERLSQLILCDSEEKVMYGFREFIKSMKMYAPKTIELYRIGELKGLDIIPEEDVIPLITGDSVDSFIAELESED